MRIRDNTRCCMRGVFFRIPLCRGMGREGKARILKSEYLLLNAAERLRDYDKYETDRRRQRKVRNGYGERGRERLSVFSYPFLVSFVEVRPIWEDNMKKAILVVSFGTSHLDTMEKTIGAIEKKLEEGFPDREFYRAFTSGMIIRKLKTEYGMQVCDVAEAMDKMYRDGIKDVLIQPTHIIHGFEYEKMTEQIRSRADCFQEIRIGTPLLGSMDDYEEAVGLIMEDSGLRDEETLVLMGHGTDHHTNAAYPALDYTFWAKGYKNVVVGTVEGFPEMDEVIKKLKEQKAKKILLMPFMIVAGDHAKNDMAGEEADSWKSVLSKEGYEVRPVLKGLGEIDGIRRMFVRHAKEAKEMPKGQ